MTGADRTRRRFASFARIAAALAIGLPILAGGARAEPSTPSPDASVGAQVARILGREQAAMDALGAARIAAIAEARRPAPRQSGTVILASRNAAPEDRAEPKTRKLDFPALDAMPRAAGDGQWACLAEAVYFEARGEPLSGQIGVAEVVLNRVDSPSYPRNVCDVTRQGVGSGRACQFSYACDGHADVMTSPVARDRAGKIARMLLDGRDRSVTVGATHFHSTAVRPGWARTLARTAAIGHHVFYRQGTLVAAR